MRLHEPESKLLKGGSILGIIQGTTMGDKEFRLGTAPLSVTVG